MNDLLIEGMASVQLSICERYGSKVVRPDSSSKIGIALSTMKLMPITGVRKFQENGTEGWYIWGGDYSDDPDFFKPVHVGHVNEIAPNIMKYLSLEPGYKFIVDDSGYEDVWFDETLLEK